MTKMPRDLWERIVDSGLVAIVTVLAFFSFIVWRLLTSESRRQKSSKSANRVFYISLNKGYFGKAIFSRLFSARYHNLKKKKKKKRYWAYVDVVLIITLSILATCLVSSNCSVTHVRWGEGTSLVLFQWRPAFSALWRCGNSVVSVHHINNFWNTRSNLTTFSGQSPQWLRMVCAKLHVKRLRIDWDINEKRSAGVVTTFAQCFALTPCRIRSDRQTTSLILKTGVCVKRVRKWGVRATWIFIMTSPVY